MDKFIEKFKYNKFYEIIKSKRNEILNNNKNAQFSFEDKISDEILENIVKLIENESFINDLIKDEKLLEELSNKELYSAKIDNIEDDFSNISIINERIKSLIKETFDIECKEKKEFILGDDKIITKSNSSIIEGNLITSDCNYHLYKDKTMKCNGDENNLNECFNNYIKGKDMNRVYQVNSLKNENPNSNSNAENLTNETETIPKVEINLMEDKTKEAKDINNDNNNTNNNISNSKDSISTAKTDKNNDDFNNNGKIKVIRKKSKEDQNNNNLGNSENNHGNGSKIDKEENTANNNPLNNNESNNMIINRENQGDSNLIQKEKIKLEEFTKKQIKILILYYLFIEELKENIKLSKTSYECYLIHKNYIKEYKEFYLYNELVQEIQKILLSDNDIRNNNTNKEEIIFNKLDNEYLKKIEKNENKYILDEVKKAQVYFKEDKNKKLSYPNDFEIINKKIYDMIKLRKDNTSFDFRNKEYLINEGKIILKLDYPDKKLDIYEIIVGTIDKTYNTFISNYLYQYNKRNGMNTHYQYLSTRTFTMFKLNNISKTNQKVLLEDINNYNHEKKVIGRIYVLNEIKEEQKDNNPAQQLLSNENNNQIVNNEPEKELKLNQQIINNIKFLTGFYLFNKDIKNQIIESNSSHKGYEKGYMINEKLFKIYLKFYDYNKLKDFLTKYDKIKLSIDKNKNLLHDENIEKISSELIKNISKDLKEKYINGFNEFNELLKNNELYSATLKRYNHMEFLFFDSCILVKENLMKLISIDDPEIQNKINNSKIEFVITDKKIIINYNFILNIGLIDENYIFNPEIIFLCSGEESLKTIKNDIKISGYKNALKKVKIKEKNVATYNSNNSILVLFINEKLITSEINH